MDAIRGFAGDDVERAVYYPQDDRYLLTTPEKFSTTNRTARSIRLRTGEAISVGSRSASDAAAHNVAAFGIVLDRLRNSTCPQQPPCYWGRTATRRGRRRFGGISAPAARSAISASA